MAVYLVVHAQITDPAKLTEYMGAVGPTLAGHSFKVLAASNTAETIVGPDRGTRVVIMEFPDRAALHAWYDSPAYAEAKKIRLAGTDGVDLIVDGF